MLFLFLNIVIPYDDMDKQSILIISYNIYIYIVFMFLLYHLTIVITTGIKD